MIGFPNYSWEEPYRLKQTSRSCFPLPETIHGIVKNFPLGIEQRERVPEWRMNCKGGVSIKIGVVEEDEGCDFDGKRKSVVPFFPPWFVTVGQSKIRTEYSNAASHHSKPTEGSVTNSAIFIAIMQYKPNIRDLGVIRLFKWCLAKTLFTFVIKTELEPKYVSAA